MIVKKYLPMTETACYILMSLTTPRHGYAISKYVSDITDKKISLGNGTLYGTLTKMEKDGVIESFSDEQNRKNYVITELGIELLDAEFQRTQLLYENLKRNRSVIHDR